MSIPNPFKTHPYISYSITAFVVLLGLLIWWSLIPTPAAKLIAVESNKLGHAIGKAIEPTAKELEARDNETRTKLNTTVKQLGDVNTRIDQGFKDLNVKVKTLEEKQIKSDELIKGIQDELKLDKKVPISELKSQLDRLQKEASDKAPNFTLRPTA